MLVVFQIYTLVKLGGKMIENQIKVLAIAPYRAMAKQLEFISGDFPEIKLSIFVGDRMEGIELAKDNFHSNYDAIISRGGTATLLTQEVSLPVFEIETSVSDVLSVFSLVDIKNHKIAIIGYPNIIDTCKALKSIYSNDIDVYEITSEEKLTFDISEIVKKRYDAIIGDVAGYTFARKYGMCTYLITSGDDSIRKVFQSVIQFYRMNLQLANDNHFFKAILQNKSINTIVLTQSGKLIYKNNKYDCPDKLLAMLKEKVTSKKIMNDQKLHVQLSNKAYTIYARTIQCDNIDYIAFDYSTSSILKKSQIGIAYYNADEVKSIYENSFYGILGSHSFFLNTIRQYNQFSTPIFLEGEYGLGKAYWSMLIYLLGSNTTSPYIQISSDLINEKSWDFLINNSQSPLCEIGATICFTALDTLPEERLSKLLTYLLSSQTSKNNHLILSFSDRGDSLIQEMKKQYRNKLHCNVLYLPPLRKNPEYIKSLATLYINWLNVTKGKSIQGFSDEALAALAGYSWPENYVQLQRVLNSCYSISNDVCINKNDVEQSLLAESNLYSISLSNSTIKNMGVDLSKPLNDIIQVVVKQVLKKNNGNKTKTAESLKISRATLWRLLKNNGS